MLSISVTYWRKTNLSEKENLCKIDANVIIPCQDFTLFLPSGLNPDWHGQQMSRKISGNICNITRTIQSQFVGAAGQSAYEIRSLLKPPSFSRNTYKLNFTPNQKNSESKFNKPSDRSIAHFNSQSMRRIRIERQLKFDAALGIVRLDIFVRKKV